MEQITLFELETVFALVPCSKCGKVPEMHTEIDTRGTVDTLEQWKGGLGDRSEPTERPLYSVDCKTCYIPDPGANAFTYNVFFTSEEAAEHWKQRVETTKEKSI